MQIVYHIGANCTDQDRLLKSLLKNSDAFAEEGIMVPGPGRYRRLIRETIQALNGAPPEPGTRDVLLDEILDASDCKRVVMSHGQFICVHRRVLEKGVFYHLADLKLRGLAQLFPEDEIEIFIGMKDFATFLPAVFAANPVDDYFGFMNGVDPYALRWSELITRIRKIVPHAKVTAWCNEDTPVLWGALVRHLAGIDTYVPVSGEFDLLANLIPPAAMAEFSAGIADKPPLDLQETRDRVTDYLNRFAIMDEIEVEVDLPGWTQETLNHLTHLYEEDMARVAQIDGVEFLRP